MHDELGNHAEEEELDEADGKAEAGPVMAVLHDLEAVALEVNVAVKVHLVERLHGDLVGAAVLGAVGILLEVQVELHGAARELGLFIATGANGGDDDPVCCQEREVDDEGKEDERLPPSADLPAEVEGNTDEEGDQGSVVEGVGPGAVGREGGILDGQILRGGRVQFSVWSDEKRSTVGAGSSSQGRALVRQRDRLPLTQGQLLLESSRPQELQYGARHAVQWAQWPRTLVVRTPHSSSFSNEGGVALGVSMNSNSLSLPLRLVGFDILTSMAEGSIGPPSVVVNGRKRW